MADEIACFWNYLLESGLGAGATPAALMGRMTDGEKLISFSLPLPASMVVSLPMYCAALLLLSLT
jgi:hypothetical protein